MNMKLFAISLLACFGVCSSAYSNSQIDDSKPLKFEQELLAEQTSNNSALESAKTKKIEGKSATGEAQTTTIDENGSLHATPTQPSNNSTPPIEKNK